MLAMTLSEKKIKRAQLKKCFNENRSNYSTFLKAYCHLKVLRIETMSMNGLIKKN